MHARQLGDISVVRAYAYFQPLPNPLANPMVPLCRAQLLELVVGDRQAIYHEVVNLPG